MHLAVNSERVRVASVKMLLEHYNASTIPVVMMGDFNTAPQGYPQYYADDDGVNSIELLLANERVTTVLPELPLHPNALTFPSEKPDRVIDWIFTSSPWRIQQHMVVSSTLSDHLPVMAVLNRGDAS